MKKILVKKEVPDTYSEFSAEDDERFHPVDKVLDRLKHIKEMGATHVAIHGSTWGDGECYEVDLNGFIIQEETDEEYEKRIAAENIKRQADEQYNIRVDYYLYLRLKEKFKDFKP